MLPILLLAAAVASPAPAAAPTPAPITAAVTQQLTAGLSALTGTTAGLTPALAVAVVEDGVIAYDHGFGDANTDTRFRIASVTKLFTAVAVMQLVEAHRVDLDAKVATYVPDAPYASQITARQLLQHTSGLWNYGDDAVNTGAAAKPTTVRDILALVATHPLTQTPGKAFAYSNSGYVVLGSIVEHVSGQPLAAYEHDHIFVPAGMNDTSLGQAPAGASVATGYLRGPGPAAPVLDPSWFYADGDAITTAADLARFDIALLGGKLVAPPTFALMQALPVRADSWDQGLGLMMLTAVGMRFVGHHGGLPGYAAEDEMSPANGFAVVVLSNAGDFLTPRANGVVISHLFPDQFSAAVLAQKQVIAAGVPAAGEDAAITTRFRTTLAGLLDGKIDRSQFSPEASAALTPDLIAQTATQLKPLGTIVKTVYLGKRDNPNGTAYGYAVTFSSGATLTWGFVLSPSGKITGIGSSG